MRKLFSLAFVLVCALGLIAPAYAADAPKPAEAAKAEEPPDLKVGDTVTDFKLKNAITGETMSFNGNIKGKSNFTVVVFMNTGCSSCLAELMELKDVLKGNPNVQFVAIAVDKRGEEVVKAYYDAYKIEATYLVDAGFSVPPMFGFNYTPAMFVADKMGKIVFMKGGYNPVRDQGKLAAAVKKIIG